MTDLQNSSFSGKILRKKWYYGALLFFWLLVFASANPLAKNADSVLPEAKLYVWLILILGSLVLVSFIRNADEKMFLLCGLVFGVVYFGLNNINVPLGEQLRCGGIMILYLILGYLAVREARYYKMVFFLVAALPRCVYEACKGSQFAVVFGAVLLFTSICWRYHFSEDQKLKLYELILLLACSIPIVCFKSYLYTPFLLQIFLIRKEAFRKRAQFWILFLAEISVICACILVHMFHPELWIFSQDPISPKLVASNIETFLEKYQEFVPRLIKNGSHRLMLNVSGLHLYAGVGKAAYWLWWFICLASLGCKDRYKAEEERVDRNIHRSFATLSLIILVVQVIVVVLNRFFTLEDIHTDVTAGFGGSYIIPLLPLFLGLLAQIPVDNEGEKYEEKVSLVMIIALLNTAVYFLLKVF